VRDYQLDSRPARPRIGDTDATLRALAAARVGPWLPAVVAIGLVTTGIY
jgi:hypothetical protein